jgi:hypothetical protein
VRSAAQALPFSSVGFSLRQRSAERDRKCLAYFRMVRPFALFGLAVQGSHGT